MTKELIEQSARPRTFQIRGAYATVLMLISYYVISERVPRYFESASELFGVGAELLAVIRNILYFGLYLILPISACGSFTIEKERKTLELLLITKLAPGTIVLEKFLSRVIPALNFVLISAPIIAFCYGLGGVNLDEVIRLMLGLVLIAIQMTAVSVMCSAAFRNTIQALVGVYLCLVFAMLLEELIAMILVNQFGLDPALTFAARTSSTGVSQLPATSLSLLAQLVAICVPSLLTTSICLFVGRKMLVAACNGGAKGIVSTWPWLWFRRRDPTMSLRRRRTTIPFDNPIVWRDQLRGSHLVTWWISTLGGVGLAVIAIWEIHSWRGTRVSTEFINRVSYYVWAGSTIGICIAGATSIVRERIQQTLDVLLATPLSGVQIVSQKMAAIQHVVLLSRLVLICCAISFTILKFDLWYLVNYAVMTWYYPKVVAWIAILSGLSAKNSVCAVFKSLLIIAAGCFFPYVVITVANAIAPDLSSVDAGLLVAVISPLTLIALSGQELGSDFDQVL